MCIICVDFNKNKLTKREAYRNLKELATSVSPTHYNEVFELIFTEKEDTHETDNSGK